MLGRQWLGIGWAPWRGGGGFQYIPGHGKGPTPPYPHTRGRHALCGAWRGWGPHAAARACQGPTTIQGALRTEARSTERGTGPQIVWEPRQRLDQLQSVQYSVGLRRRCGTAEPQPPPPPPPPPPPCVTVRRVVVSLRGPGQSPVLPFACCVGSLRSVGHCGRCSCWCRFRVRGAQ